MNIKEVDLDTMFEMCNYICFEYIFVMNHILQEAKAINLQVP